MTRLATSFVLGYHGCSKEVAYQAVEGNIGLLQSERDFDWLGPGAYFWEADPQRAEEWAEWKVSRGDFEDAAVIGAVIDLRNCLDLVSRHDLDLVAAAYSSFREMCETAGLPIPMNKSAPGEPNADRVLRFLDCAVIKHLHNMIESDATIEPFDTVRGMFTEGGDLYPGSGFAARAHTQIAVRNVECVLGVFWPR